MAKLLASSNLGTQPDTYLFSLSSSALDKNLLATIGSDDALRLFDPSLRVLHTTPRCHAGVACLAASGDNGRAPFVTGGRDSLIRCWDARAGGCKQALQLSDPLGNGIAALACHDQYVAAGTESDKEGGGDVSVLVFDCRNPRAPLRHYGDSHADTITQLAFHPAQPRFLLSGSTDGLVSILDVQQADEDDALQQVLNPRSAVHCAGFLASDQVYVVSTDEQYSIHTLMREASEEDEVLPPPIQFGDVRKTLQCTYVINVLLQADGPPLMAFGNNEEQTLSIVSLGAPGAWTFGQRIDLPGGHGGDIVRDVLLQQRRAYSCAEDGSVKVWNLGS